METRQTKTAELKYAGDGVLYIRMFDDVEIDLSHSKSMQKASMELTAGEKFVALIDARAKIIVSQEAREWGSSSEAQKNMLAQAVIVNSLANKIVGNFIIQFHKPTAKTKLFSDEKTALVWLKKQLKELKND